MSISLFVYLSICLSVCPYDQSICLAVSLSVYLSSFLSMHPNLYLYNFVLYAIVDNVTVVFLILERPLNS